MIDWNKWLTISVSISTILALFVSIWSLWVSYDSAYGEANLNLKYTVGGDFNQPIDFFIYRNNTASFQFLIKNTGHGSTAISIEPQVKCAGCYLSMGYNGKEFLKTGEEGKRGIDIHPISPQSTELIMVKFDNITREEAGQAIKIISRDIETDKHITLSFKKMDEKYSDLLFKLFGTNE